MHEVDGANRAALAKRGRELEYITIAWNAIEGIVAVAAGAIAGSVSLIAFGADSFIEMASGTALLWRMAVDADAERRLQNEKHALRIVGMCFLLLAAYVLYESAADLWSKRIPEHSFAGIIIAALALVIMPLLSRAKRKIGRDLGSGAMRADAKQSEFCAYLSAILLAGLVLNAAFGLWWADGAAALIMVPIIAQEGMEALEGKACADCL